MALTAHPISATERARRTRIFEEAQASVRLEGFELDDRTKAVWCQYIEGEMTLAEVGSAIDELDQRDFGPLPLPRQKCP